MFSPSEDDELESGDSSASDSSDRIRIKITLDTLKETQTFIEDLRHATLDNSGMSDPALARLRDPPLNASSLVADKDLRLSLDLFMASTNGSQKTYAKSRAAVQRRYPGADILSHYQVRNRLETLSGVSPILHDRCPNTCMAYTGQFSSLTSCPTCAEPRYDRVSGKRKAVPRAQFHTYPLGPQLQALYASPESAKNMAYRRERTAKLKSRVRQPDGTYNIETYEDYIDGSDYLDAVEQGKIGENEVLVVLSIDGAQLYEKKKSDCWMYIWIVYELGPDQRYKVANVLPGGIIPGPNKPQNVDSFTFPGLYHLSALQKEGLPVYDAYRKERSVKTPFFVFGTADGPGLVYLNGGAGHMGYYGCRLSCPTPGRRVGQSTNYYPAILRPSGDLPRGSGHEDIDVQTMSVASFSNYQERLAVLLAVQNRHQYIGARFSTGLTKQSLFSGLRLDRMFPVPTCFPSDMMHLICLNLTDLLLALWRGTIEVGEGDSKDTWDWVVLVGDAWKDHGKAVEDLRQYLLSTIERPPRNPYKAINSGYKAQEWLIYVFGYCPALLHGLLPDKYWKNFCKLVAAVRLLSLRSITVSQVLQAHVWLLEFVQEFEELYVQRKQSRIHFVRQCVHNLIHLAPETFRTGPQGNHAQWTMERMIGSLGEEIKQPSKPYENLSQRGILRAQINAISHMCPDLASTSPSSSASSSSRTASGYTLLSPCDSARRSILDDERDALTTYLADHTEYRGGTPDKLVRWGRLELPNGMQVRTAWKEKARAVDQFKRTARMVTVSTLFYLFWKVDSYVLCNICRFSLTSATPQLEKCSTSFNLYIGKRHTRLLWLLWELHAMNSSIATHLVLSTQLQCTCRALCAMFVWSK